MHARHLKDCKGGRDTHSSSPSRAISAADFKVHFIWIRTQLLRVEGVHADHKTTAMAIIFTLYFGYFVEANMGRRKS